jgi:hypothetical protein
MGLAERDDLVLWRSMMRFGLGVVVSDRTCGLFSFVRAKNVLDWIEQIRKFLYGVTHTSLNSGAIHLTLDPFVRFEIYPNQGTDSL